MPGQDQYVKLPDGSYVHIPASATKEQLAQLKTKLSSQFSDPLKTGEGMEARAHAQATPAQRTGLPEGGTPSYTAMALENSPSGADPQNPGNPNLNAIPEASRADVNSDLLGVAASTTPLIGAVGNAAEEGFPAVMRLARGVVGGTGGAIAGAGGGGRIGEHFGDTGRKIGETVGGLAGGIVGGGLAAGLERQPATMNQRLAGEPGRIGSLPFGIQRFMPDWMVPGPSEDALAATKARAEQEQLGAFMNRGYRQVGAPSSLRLLGAPDTDMPDVIHAPITSESNWLQRPEGNIQNVPRREIPGMIQRTGDPAAVREARRLGSTVLYVPEQY